MCPQFFPVRLKRQGADRWDAVALASSSVPSAVGAGAPAPGPLGPAGLQSQLLHGHLEAGFKSRWADSQPQPFPRATLPGLGKGVPPWGQEA